MKKADAAARARMPEGTHKVLDRRTLALDNRNLLKWLKDGVDVLDVGCGSGAITKGIAEKVSPGGRVTGIDPNEQLIELGAKNYENIPNLQFQVADVNTFNTHQRYDVITCARVLQWLSNPEEVIMKLKCFLKKNGVLAILDYNHQKIQWEPTLPAEMQQFYDAFLQWRRDAGFDNEIADHLAGLLQHAGFQHITVEPQLELTSNNDDDFITRAGIWLEVAATRGHQLVKDNYISEEQRVAAINAYNAWLAHEGRSMQMYLLAVEGIFADHSQK